MSLRRAPARATRAPRPRPGARRLLAAAGAALAAAALSGCAQTVSLDAAPHANNPGCAAISVRLPGTIAGQGQQHTDAQGTSAWGDPATVILRCGVALLGPTTQPCITVDGVDWVLESSQNTKVTRYITFGRDPATELIIERSGSVSAASVLPAISVSVRNIKATARCLGPNDAVTPTPLPAS
jgi:hypothetical protein